MAAVVAIIVIVILLVTGVIGGKKSDTTQQTANLPQATAVPAQNVSSGNVTSNADLSAQLGAEDNELAGLRIDQQVKISDLSINNNLPDEWLNVLLLGADARDLTESCRTDTMMICSISKKTGQVKLTSIARDTAIKFDNIGSYNGTYRINAANFFGGPELAMQTVNEALQMNIQHYVLVNFYGFEYIVEKLGGVDITITQAEMEEINTWQRKQYGVEEKYGYDMSGLEKVLLETYGENTHLNGRQCLAYCRIRKLDSDFSRTERQRNVLSKLKEKLVGMGVMDITSMVVNLQQYFSTNLDINTIVTTAASVLSSNNFSVGQFRVPVNGSYVQETRNEQSMLYDSDWAKNSLELYNFIYE